LYGMIRCNGTGLHSLGGRDHLGGGPCRPLCNHQRIVVASQAIATASRQVVCHAKVNERIRSLCGQACGVQTHASGIAWLAAVVPSLDSCDWKYGIEDNSIAFLPSCCERHGEEIARNSSLHAAFLALLTAVVSRGGHAAIALRDRVVATLAA
jgi:hypothetical protein